MKTTVILLIALLVFSVAFPILYTLRYTPPVAEDAPVQPEKLSAETSVDHDITVRVKNGDKTADMKLDEYLIGVTAAEMPAGFETEALMAQATAARTYTLYKMTVAPSSKHPDADVCTDSACCKAYIDEETMRSRWGEKYDEYRAKIENAVNGTDGECVVYGGEPILAVFHSSSAGMTENSGSVWNDQLPYLVSVFSPESGEEVPKFTETVEIPYEDFKKTVSARYPSVSFPAYKKSWITDIRTDASGRIESANICGVTLTGGEVRSLFSLRSTAMTFSFTDDGVSITTTGYGHGVGMSQYGANALACDGMTHEEILKWYYTGAEIGNAEDYV